MWAADRSHVALSGQVPWQSRRAIGELRAYLRTASLGTWHPEILSRTTRRGLSQREARLFRWATVLLVVIPWSVVCRAMIGWGTYPWSATSLAVPRAPEFTRWFEGIYTWPVTLGGVILFAIGMTGLHTLWYHPQQVDPLERRRGWILSHYIVVPMAGLAMILLFVGLVVLLETTGISIPRLVPVWSAAPWLRPLLGNALIAAIGIGVVVFAIAIINHIILLRRTTYCGWGGALLSALGLILSWILLAALSFGLLPWLAGWIFLSLRG